MSARRKILLHELQFFSIIAEEFVCIIPNKKINDVEEGDILCIYPHDYRNSCVSCGHVSSVWETEVGTQIIHTVETSVASSS